MRIPAATLLTLAAITCGACVPDAPFPANTGVIVSQDILDGASCGRFPTHGDGAWTPSGEDIGPLEAALFERLVPALQEDAALYEIEPLAPSDYYRRYAGVTVSGRRLIAICGESRSLYDERGLDWRTGNILYRDGGAMSFSAYYDPATQVITYFEFGYVG